MAKNWIAQANLKEGAFTQKAHKHHMGVQEYAAEVTKEGSHASAKTKRQATLAKTFAKMKHK